MPANRHRADIVAALHKAGTSLSQLGRDNGLADSTLRAALSRPAPRSNKIIADFLEAPLHVLWPAWFDRTGNLIARKPASRAARQSTQKRNAA